MPMYKDNTLKTVEFLNICISITVERVGSYCQTTIQVPSDFNFSI